jgi:hypothetical protein
MPRLGPISRADLIDKLRALGFEGPIQGKKHAFMRKGLRTPRLPNTDVDDVDLLRRILKQAGVSRDEFLDA